MAFQYKLRTAAFLLLLGNHGPALAGQNEQAPTKELVKYISEAKRRGVSESKIKKEAITVGWASAVVDETLAAMKSGQVVARATEGPSAAATPPAATSPASAREAAAPNPAPVVARGSSDDY